MQKLPALLLAVLPAISYAQEGETIPEPLDRPRFETRVGPGFAQTHVLNARELHDANPSHTFTAGFTPVATVNVRYTPRPDGRLFFSTGVSAWFVNAGPNLRISGEGYDAHARFRQSTTVLALPLRAGLHLTRDLDVEAGVAISANLPSRGTSASAGMSSWGRGPGDTSFTRMETLDLNATSVERAYSSAIVDVQASHNFGRRWFVSLRGAAQMGEGTAVQSAVSLTTGSPMAAPQTYRFSGSPRLAWISVGVGMRIF